MDIDPRQWTVPLFVGVGLIISQLFIYGKKVKRRVKITTGELVGDAMQLGVRMVITIASIGVIEIVIQRKMTDVWQIVAVTICICTSFDTYFVKVRELALKRVIGAAGVLMNGLPDNGLVELNSDDEGTMKVTTIKGIDHMSDADVRKKIPLRVAYQPSGGGEIEAETVDLLGRLDNVPDVNVGGSDDSCDSGDGGGSCDT